MEERIQKILCAVDDTPAGEQAAEQAIKIAAAGAKLQVVAVDHTLHELLRRPPELSEETLRAVVDRTVATAVITGVEACGQILSGRVAGEALLVEAESHDLLLIGTHGHSRAAGIGLAHTATELAHRTRTPLLVARESSKGSASVERILLATDGSPSSWPAVRMAAELAESFGSQIWFVHVHELARPRRGTELDAQQQLIEGATQGSVEVVDVRGRAAPGITGAAKKFDSSLIVMGHRGVRGPHALLSVGERVFHRAPCSVLLVPRHEGRGSPGGEPQGQPEAAAGED